MVPNNGIPFENEVVPSIGSTNQQNSLLFSLPKISSVTISASVLDKILYISFSTFKSYSVSKLPSSLRILSEYYGPKQRLQNNKICDRFSYKKIRINNLNKG